MNRRASEASTVSAIEAGSEYDLKYVPKTRWREVRAGRTGRVGVKGRIDGMIHLLSPIPG